MKIALLGNMNNGFFSLGLYLRDLNYDVTLFIFDNNISHFDPHCDVYSTSDLNWIEYVNWGSAKALLTTSSLEINKDLSSFDIIIGCGLSPAYTFKAGLKLDMFIPYGSDIYEETKIRISRSIRNLIAINYAQYLQKRGLHKCQIINMAMTNSIYETRIKQLAPFAGRWTVGYPFIHTKTYDELRSGEFLVQSRSSSKFLEFVADNNFIVVSHMRHKWGGNPNDPNEKGNDRLLRGWSMFMKRNEVPKAKLILFEYGQDVNKSKRLVEHLGISNSIHWEPLLPRKEIMPRLDLSHLVCGEFHHSWATSGVLHEALVMGKPILSYRNDDLYRNDNYDILNARTPEEIFDKLCFAYDNPSIANSIGERGRIWYDNNVVNPFIKKFTTFLGQNG